MTARELNDWYRFCFHHPLPFELTDIHGGLLLALTANINRSRNSPVVDPVDYMVLRRKTTPDAEPTLTIAQRMKRVANSR